MKYAGLSYDDDFIDKVVVVTGGASGIGRAVTEAFQTHKAKIAFLDKDKERGNKLAQSYDGLSFHYCHLSDPAWIHDTCREIENELGPPDILVNNAGIEYNNVGNIVTMPRHKLENIIEVNLYGYVNMVREIVPLMEQAGGGKIVNVSSLQAYRPVKPGTSYQLTKGAILDLTRVLAFEYGRKNIRINAVVPGAISTEGMGFAREGVDDIKASTPLGRRGHAVEVAHGILWLCSSGASFCHGTELFIDGGASCGNENYGVPDPPVPNDPDV